MPRGNFNSTLINRLRTSRPTAHLFPEIVVQEDEDVKDTKTEWDAADSLTGLQTWSSGVVTLSGANATLLDHTAGTDQEITDFDDSEPFQGAKVVWSGTNIAIARIHAYLDPDADSGGSDIHPGGFYRMTVYRVTEVVDPDTVSFRMVPIAEADAPSEASAALVEFDFAESPNQLVSGPAPHDPISGTFEGPTHYIFIRTFDSNGDPVGNVAWYTDSGTSEPVTDNGHDLYGMELNDDLPGTFVETATTINVPRMTFEVDSVSAATITFTTNGLTLTGTVSGDEVLECVGSSVLPAGTSVTYEINDTVASGWVEFQPGDVIGVDNAGIGGEDLSTVTVRTGNSPDYHIRATLTPNGNVSPILQALGVRLVDRTAFHTIGQVQGGRVRVDPVTLKGEITEAQVTFLHDGARDYTDEITTILKNNHIGDMEMRLWWGDEFLDRQHWGYVDSFLIDDYESTDGGISVLGVSPLSLLRGAVPQPVDSGGYSVSDFTISNDNLATAASSIFTEINFPDRWTGQQITNTTDTVTRTVTVEDRSDGKVEADAVAFLAGGSYISSQGKVQFVDFYDVTNPVAVFTNDMIEEGTITPGFRYRIPELFFYWNFDYATDKEFDSADRIYHAEALTELGLARIEAPHRVDDIIEKYVDNQTLAQTAGTRVVQSLGTGLILWPFRTKESWPELLPGDLISIQTDKFVVKDPLTDTAISGRNFYLARIASATLDGRDFEAWIQGYGDITASTESVTVS